MASECKKVNKAWRSAGVIQHPPMHHSIFLSWGHPFVWTPIAVPDPPGWAFRFLFWSSLRWSPCPFLIPLSFAALASGFGFFPFLSLVTCDRSISNYLDKTCLLAKPLSLGENFIFSWLNIYLLFFFLKILVQLLFPRKNKFNDNFFISR